MNYALSKKKAKELLEAKLSHFMGVSPEEATDEQYYKAIALILRDMMSAGRADFSAQAAKAGTKKVYYLCMEFLMGRSLKNNLYNLNLTDVFQSVLADYDVKLENLYECEPDAGLGNGGLGRLAACYLDGLATQGYPARGYSILYEAGIVTRTCEFIIASQEYFVAVVECRTPLPVHIGAQQVARTCHYGLVGAFSAAGEIARRSEEVVPSIPLVNIRTLESRSGKETFGFGFRSDARIVRYVEFQDVEVAETAPEKIGLAVLLVVILVDGLFDADLLTVDEHAPIRKGTFGSVGCGIADDAVFYISEPERIEKHVFVIYATNLGSPQITPATVTDCRGPCLVGESRSDAFPGDKVFGMEDRVAVAGSIEVVAAVIGADDRRIGGIGCDDGIRIGRCLSAALPGVAAGGKQKCECA